MQVQFTSVSQSRLFVRRVPHFFFFALTQLPRHPTQHLVVYHLLDRDNECTSVQEEPSQYTIQVLV